ncbi:A/G-specific adenine glycosylase [soil metagenome]
MGWYFQRARELRFRGTPDPWAILVSEVMAQQTQVARVELAWVGFMERFPTPDVLAEAPTAEVLQAWAGLGYNRRAVLLQRAARTIVEQHRGAVPGRLADLETLPGVGPYTARAVAAIAFGLPVGAVDTNVRRVVARLRGVPDASVREVQQHADALVDPLDPAAWTHALMDLGASVCLAREPRCGECPLRPWCLTAWEGPGVGPPRLARPRVERTRGRARPFEHTSRWLRGRIVARLRELEHGEWAHLPDSMGSHDPVAIESALQALQRDGLVERHADGGVRLPSTPA